jgi:hypothetical protein
MIYHILAKSVLNLFSRAEERKRKSGGAKANWKLIDDGYEGERGPAERHLRVGA